MRRTDSDRRCRSTDNAASGVPTYRAWVTICLAGASYPARLHYKRWGVSRVREALIPVGIPPRGSHEIYPAQQSESNIGSFLSLAASA